MTNTVPSVDLTQLNSFGVVATADGLLEFNRMDQVTDVIKLTQQHPYLILGGGSNLLLLGHLPCQVIHVTLSGWRYHDETNEHIHITINAGENWHNMVMQTLNDGYSGLENLSLIPGTVGAAPVQNIGAYGVELKEYLQSVEAIDLKQGKLVSFDNQACNFDYRNSYFKQNIGRFLITSVTLKLNKQFKPRLEYRPLNELAETTTFSNSDYQSAMSTLTAKQVAEKVIAVRQQKLPDPDALGNAGSFFKNPIIDKAHFLRLKSQFPTIVAYPVGEQQMKVAAGWLIDQLGFKGVTHNGAAVHTEQALVLVNQNNASGQAILELSQQIQQKVEKVFGIRLEREVRLISEQSITEYSFSNDRFANDSHSPGSLNL